TTLLNDLIKAEETVSIKIGKENIAFRTEDGDNAGDTTVQFNPDYQGDTVTNADGTKGRPEEIGLAHELLHADENSKAKGKYDKTPVTIINPDGKNPGGQVEVQRDEIIVRERENKIREEQGVTPRLTPTIVN